MNQLDWGQGRYESTAPDLLPAARELVAAARIQPGEHVVDVGAGTGNVALLAADLGARVTAVEPAARLREVIQQGGRDLTVVDGTAASMPLPDGSADVLLSNFAVIFAPDPKAAIAELARVSAPNGRILLTAWLPGVLDEVLGILINAVTEVIGSDPTEGGIDWSDPAVLTTLLEPHGFQVTGTTKDLTITTHSAEDYWSTRIAGHPMGVAALPLLEQAGVLADVRSRTLTLITANWTTPSGVVRLPAPYLLAEAVR
ncbi:ubiquinone/menaquinone biosynthesis C-methylase UbiE [Kribbella steppae]|uniref:Ubiquinone/menaquinone biosynthesis C-methylase UbiE n=1 Tax=Kribbella steppae TaxID=2512223 RepID=A0A4R2HT56_9ACTN|nr:methyltransferase domain-containing protein [Kribbella steppae]TCO34176.1 ubiquinone/menaquinone biosynthesis C-methylase UbiE [Kribbella steppae]